jgi:hypothetical protein
VDAPKQVIKLNRDVNTNERNRLSFAYKELVLSSCHGIHMVLTIIENEEG